MDIDEWKSQIKRGTLEFCILQMIDTQSLYGYEIISRLEAWPILAAKEGLPPRKYYTITESGRAYLQAMSCEWEKLLAAVAAVRMAPCGRMKGDEIYGSDTNGISGQH